MMEFSALTRIIDIAAFVVSLAGAIVVVYIYVEAKGLRRFLGWLVAAVLSLLAYSFFHLMHEFGTLDESVLEILQDAFAIIASAALAYGALIAYKMFEREKRPLRRG